MAYYHFYSLAYGLQDSYHQYFIAMCHQLHYKYRSHIFHTQIKYPHFAIFRS